MKEEIINGIKYRLDEETLTAEVIELKDDFECDETKLTAKKLMKMIFNGYEGDIIIPETVVFNERTYRVTSIGEEAFAGSYSLKSVTIPDSVTSIGDGAFNDCESLTTKVEIGEKIIDGIKYILYCNRTAKVIQKSTRYKGDIIIPETVEFKGVTYRVTSIGKRAFENCEKLTSVTIPDSVKSIGKHAFDWCFELASIAIPDSVSSIGDRVFSECFALKSITIGNGVTSIGKTAFMCCRALTSITFQGTIVRWKKIELGGGWNDDIPAKVVHCTDGDVEI